MKYRILCLLIIFLYSKESHALELNEIITGFSGLSWYMVGICIIIGILTIAIKSTVSGQDESVSHLLMRMFFIIVAIVSASFIQHKIMRLGFLMRDQLFPNMNIETVIDQMEVKINNMQLMSVYEADEDPSWAQSVVNAFILNTLQIMEAAVIYLLFFVFRMFEQLREILTVFLGAIAPFMIMATIIPGVNGFTNWIKLNCNLALWPLVSTFFLKAHIVSIEQYLGDAVDFLNQGPLDLFCSSILFIILFLATPIIANILISGSGMAFSMASSMVVGSTSFMVMRNAVNANQTIQSISKRFGKSAGSGAVSGIRSARQNSGTTGFSGKSMGAKSVSASSGQSRTPLGEIGRAAQKRTDSASYARSHSGLNSGAAGLSNNSRSQLDGRMVSVNRSGPIGHLRSQTRPVPSMSGSHMGGYHAKSQPAPYMGANTLRSLPTNSASTAWNYSASQYMGQPISNA